MTGWFRGSLRFLYGPVIRTPGETVFRFFELLCSPILAETHFNFRFEVARKVAVAAFRGLEAMPKP